MHSACSSSFWRRWRTSSSGCSRCVQRAAGRGCRRAPLLWDGAAALARPLPPAPSKQPPHPRHRACKPHPAPPLPSPPEQSAKHAKLAARKRLTAEQAAGFIQTGLWRYSRHPNFFSEQCLWWSMYLFSVGATGEWANWTAAGPAALTLLFQASTALTERITADKYPRWSVQRSRGGGVVGRQDCAQAGGAAGPGRAACLQACARSAGAAR